MFLDQFGLARQIHLDWGKNFESKLFQELSPDGHVEDTTHRVMAKLSG